MVQAGVGIHSAVRITRRSARTTFGLLVRRPALRLGLPMIADLLEGVLQRRVCGLLGTSARPVRLHRGVVRFHPRFSRVLR